MGNSCDHPPSQPLRHEACSYYGQGTVKGIASGEVSGHANRGTLGDRCRSRCPHHEPPRDLAREERVRMERACRHIVRTLPSRAPMRPIQAIPEHSHARSWGAAAIEPSSGNQATAQRSGMKDICGWNGGSREKSRPGKVGLRPSIPLVRLPGVGPDRRVWPASGGRRTASPHPGNCAHHCHQ